MCDDFQGDYLSDFHEEYMREYIRFELERQERVSTQFLQDKEDNEDALGR